MPEKKVLVVSKPLVPPFDDSGKNLAWELVKGGERYTYHVMVTPRAPAIYPDHCKSEPVYPSQGTYSAGLKQNLPVLGRLMKPDQIPIYHYFFAPNPLSCKAAGFIHKIKKRATIHTVLSIPRTFVGIDRLMFADVVIALSETTATELERHGVKQVRVIRPGISAKPRQTAEKKHSIVHKLGLPPHKPIILFAGDLEIGKGAQHSLKAFATLIKTLDAHLVLACRRKTQQALEIEERLKGEIRGSSLHNRVTYLNEVDEMVALLSAASVLWMPVESLYAKMDFPLIILEALRELVPVVAFNIPHMAELQRLGCILTAPVGDTEEFVKITLDLLRNEQQRLNLVRKARTVQQSIFNNVVMAYAYEDLYDEMLSQRLRS